MNISINLNDEKMKGLLASSLDESKETVLYNIFVDSLIDTFVDEKFNERRVPVNLFVMNFLESLEISEKKSLAKVQSSLCEDFLSGRISKLEKYLFPS
jgi:hypothetical protein